MPPHPFFVMSLLEFTPKLYILMQAASILSHAGPFEDLQGSSG